MQKGIKKPKDLTFDKLINTAIGTHTVGYYKSK